MISVEGIKELIKNPKYFFASRTFNENIFIYLLKKILFIVLVIFFFPFSIFIYFTKIRAANIFSERIGHQLLETLSIINDEEYKDKKIIITRNKEVANKYFYEFEMERIVFIKSKFLSFIIKSIFFAPFTKVKIEKYLRNTNKIYSYKIFKNQTNKYLKLSTKQELQREKLFESVGIKRSDKLVCIANRELGYSIIDDKKFNYRNCSIKNFAKAVKYLNNIGYYVIRFGNSNNNFDYSHTKYLELNQIDNRLQNAEFYFASTCEFFLGTTSGVNCFATIFNKPSLITNNAPIASNHWLPQDLIIFKKYKHQETKEVQKFSKIIELKLENVFDSKIFENNGLELVENNEDEILSLVKEHMNLISFSENELKNIKLAKKNFLRNLKINNKNLDYNANISNDFVLKNINLFI